MNFSRDFTNAPCAYMYFVCFEKGPDEIIKFRDEPFKVTYRATIRNFNPVQPVGRAIDPTNSDEALRHNTMPDQLLPPFYIPQTLAGRIFFAKFECAIDGKTILNPTNDNHQCFYQGD